MWNACLGESQNPTVRVLGNRGREKWRQERYWKECAKEAWTGRPSKTSTMEMLNTSPVSFEVFMGDGKNVELYGMRNKKRGKGRGRGQGGREARRQRGGQGGKGEGKEAKQRERRQRRGGLMEIER